MDRTFVLQMQHIYAKDAENGYSCSLSLLCDRFSFANQQSAHQGGNQDIRILGSFLLLHSSPICQNGFQVPASEQDTYSFVFLLPHQCGFAHSGTLLPVYSSQSTSIQMSLWHKLRNAYYDIYSIFHVFEIVLYSRVYILMCHIQNQFKVYLPPICTFCWSVANNSH